MIKVLIADDHPFFRSAVGYFFAGTEDIRVVGECADGCEVVDTAVRTHPDVVLMDLRMPTMSGLVATQLLWKAQRGLPVLVMTASVNAATAAAREAAALGVPGFVLKADDCDALPEQVRTVAAGGSVWSPVVAAAVPFPASWS